MSDYKWCHGPNCHTYHTVDRIRGSKDNKVLRTKRIQQYEHSRNSFYSNFCSNRCYDDFGNKYIQQQYSWGRSSDWYDTTITEK